MMDEMEDMLEMEEEFGGCPVCGGSGMVMKPNDAAHPCSRCASERMRGDLHKGMPDTHYKAIMPELR